MGLIGSYLGVIQCGGSGVYMSPISFVKSPVMWVEVRLLPSFATVPGATFRSPAGDVQVQSHTRAIAQLWIQTVREEICGKVWASQRNTGWWCTVWGAHTGPVLPPTHVQRRE